MNKTMRFATYLAYANQHQHEPWISSRDISEYCDIHPSQVRRDLANLKPVGRRGTGYRPTVIQALLGAELEPVVDQLLEDSRRMAALAGGIHLTAVRLKNASS